VIDCPTCAQPLTLPAAILAPPPRSFFQRFKDAGRAVLDKRKLKALLLESVSDGVLTSEEIAEIHAMMPQTGIDKSILAEWSEDILEKAVDSITLTNLSMARVQSIEGVKEFLGPAAHAVTKQNERLYRWRYIAAIREGTLPVQNIKDVVLRKGESVHWIEPAKLWEEHVVSRRFEGGSSGVSIRVAKGLSFRVGQSRGHYVADTADVPVSEGNFIITNRRLIFQGQAKSFETKLDKLLEMENHLDGIRYSESNKQKRRMLQYYSKNGDIIVEILNQVIARFGMDT
jgi:hypothetical protein